MNYSLEQKKILESNFNFIQVIAAAGSGKTSTMIALLSKIISEKKENEEEILVITFTRKATEEIKERLEKKVGVTKIKIHTFHAYSLSVLQRFNPEFNLQKAEIIEEEEKRKLFKEFFMERKFLVGGIPYDLLLSTPKFLQKHFPELEKEIKEFYQNYKKKKNKLDFDDLIEIYLDALEKNLDWTILAKQEIKRVIVDEFQDTDFRQLKWLKLLEPEKLTVVGDDWQAIYGFRGATTEPFLNFSNFFSPTEKFFLSTNYRSLKKIISVSAIPISKNKKNIPKKVKSFREGKSITKKILLEEKNLEEFKNQLIQFPNEYKILARSNHRLRFYEKLGIPNSNLLTIHSSKGLEFDTVFLDLCSGWNVSTKEENDILEEERRILYVGLSRAKNNLFILGNKKKKKDRLEDLFFSYFRFSVFKIDPEQMLKLFSKTCDKD